ncbi:CHAT domain-containing protein [Flagellimonas nanhaiensis]|uniref:CHAT domain-containing protein n=1 Tax=Flagellimonas nanhaiensis TaxID=2292706 RepID=A0A371JRM7_9FLAO|nr:CHAT domain-containing tetratricopeptide repeat protein [Allomuricauda nanhaiensis]RDY60161.1 CHAT domain-containing protein [Allomuricauda nanhaiensis]
MFGKNKFIFPFLMALCCQSLLHSQEGPTLDRIDSLIAIDQLEKARNLILNETEKDTAHLNLGKLVYPLGKIEFLKDKNTSFNDARALLQRIENKRLQDTITYEGLLGMGLLHVDQGSVVAANDYVLRANTLAKSIGNPLKNMESEFHLSEIGLKLGDFNQLLQRTENALGLIKGNPSIKFPLAPRTYNYKASLSHFMGHPDSANYYFERALKSVSGTSDTPENRYYLPGTIYGNWVMVKQSEGDYHAAMDMTLSCITHFNTFLEKTNNHSLTEKVHGNLTIAYRNLGSLYNDVGNKERAKQIAALGYHHAKNNLLPNTVQYFSSILMMAEAHLYSRDLYKSRKYLEEAERSLSSIPGDNLSYWGNLFNVYGDLESEYDNYDDAISYYHKTLSVYEKNNPDGYSQNQIYTQLNLAQTYSRAGVFNQAKDLLNKTQEKVQERYGKGGYLDNAVSLSKIRVLFSADKYSETVTLCDQLLKNYNSQFPGNERNKYYFGADQAQVVMFLAKAKYGMLTTKTPSTLTEITKLVDQATEIVENRRSLVSSQQAVADLIENNKEVFDFAKKVYLDLYGLTRNDDDLEKVMALHESAIYNKIRARLNLIEGNLAPAEIKEREQLIKDRMNSFFDAETETQFDVSEWEKTSKDWDNHLDSIQKNYPEYHDMRYASIVRPLTKLKKSINPETTIVRYFFVGKNLYAFVHNNTKTSLVELSNTMDNECIRTISNYASDTEVLFNCLKTLYDELWAPLTKYVDTKNVIIFPDAELFNLSFELLTSEKVSSLKDISKVGLLSKHNISYNYSLLLLENGSKTLQFDNDFVAFVPEFDHAMKANYQMAISDSLFLDKAYLTLLPQPFSTDLAKKFGKKFDGNTFLNSNASKQLFSESAKEHKIIHIGTHAESNNVNPELSRLVFAKNVSDSVNINDNYLYTYEIYNQNLSSNLAILTACETGKPTYQPGEGMISLAHAFNYAGSESILTSLWQIDEQSSTQILDYFYDYLSEGKPKDEALRLAKLDYLQNADGRTLHPQYWAGLVLMGNTSAIELSTDNHWLLWGLGLVFLTFLLWWIQRKRPSTN